MIGMKTNLTGGIFIPTLVHAYDCVKSNVTEFSQYYLMFWCKLKQGLDLHFGLQIKEQLHRAHHNCVSWLEDKLHWAYNLAQEMHEQEAKCHICQYDHKIRCT